MTSARHAFVTGAGSGIGREIALSLAARGHRVTLAGRRTAPLKEVRERITRARGDARIADDCDVTRAERVDAALAAAIEAFGDVAVLINCAGVAPSAPFDTIDADFWQSVLDVNLTGAFNVTRTALPSLRRAGRGRIVNIASTAGLVGYAYVAAYCAAKHGLIGLTRALALELARTDITVNAVCPGFTDTPLLDGAVTTISSKTGRTSDEARSTLAKSNPQGRLVASSEVADAVLWLSSLGAGSVTGQAIVVAGGEVMAG